jgi:prevent-host-death family protein
MNVLLKAIVSNSDMIKSYKTCREKAENFCKIIILKNNVPDAVLMSIKEYERISILIEHLKRLESDDLARVIASLAKEDLEKITSLITLK